MGRILVVDDNEAVRQSLAFVLEEDGHTVTEAANGRIALESLQSENFDLAIIDVWMPEIGGISILRKARERWPDLPVIMISGGGPTATLEEMTARADIHGALNFLYKPIEKRELLDAVSTALSS